MIAEPSSPRSCSPAAAHELANLLWRDIDLANRRIYVGRSKTDAGLREIPMLALLIRS